MRKAWGRIALLLALAAIALSGTARASSFYQMNGQGTIRIDGGGLPACLGGQGYCTHEVNTTFDWGDLTVQGLGVLQDQQIAGQYTCTSKGGSGSSAWVSKIYGNTSDFELTFNFSCSKGTVNAAGPNYVVGWFSNVVDNKPTGAGYHRVPAGHEFNVGDQLIRPGAFAFAGFFRASSTPLSPYSVTGGSADVPMGCGGGFAPTNNVIGDGLTITTAAFIGSCQTASA